MDMRMRLNNGVEIPRVGMGGWAMKKSQIMDALACGYHLLDTAAQYGNEEEFGFALEESGLPRENVFLTTKLWTEEIRQGRTKEAFQESLSRLRTDYIDLYLIHWPAEGFEEAWLTMEQLYQEGRIRAIGVSNFEPHHLERLAYYGAQVMPAVNQIESHPYFSNQGVIDYCKEKGIIVEAWCPIGGPGSREMMDPVIQGIAEENERTPAQIMIRWQLQRGVIAIPKTSRLEKMKENRDVFCFELTDVEMEAISKLERGKRLGAHPDKFEF